MKVIAYIIYGVSQALYKLFGVNTKIKKAWLKQEADELQDALDNQHVVKEYVNNKINGVYTTKRAMEIAEENNWI